MKRKIPVILISILVAVVFHACKEEPFENPFLQNPMPPAGTNPDTAQWPEGSFPWIHAKVFKPTCANSGCHDGNFEPDFRTVQSSYHTLVFQPVIKNSPSGSFVHRVVPGNAGASVLLHRMLVDIDGQSGIMPLSVDAQSDWPEKKAFYIEKITQWIAQGAKDAFGNAPQIGNMSPQINGFAATAAGSAQAFPREVGQGTVLVPASATSLDLWFAIEDLETPAAQLQMLALELSPSPDDFSQATALSLPLWQAQSIQLPGYLAPQTAYHFRANMLTSSLTLGSTYFVRLSLRDQANGPTYLLPHTDASPFLKRYLSIRRE